MEGNVREGSVMQGSGMEIGQRPQFVIDDPELCYLDGNSLGRLPKAAAERVMEVVNDGWGKQLIGGWNADWITLPQRVGGKLARLMGCQAKEVIVADSTSVNLFKLATAALRYQKDRSVVLTDAANFPSDFYILDSAIRASGMPMRRQVVGTAEQVEIGTEQIVSQINADTALVCLSLVAFKSGQLHELETITSAAHSAGALVLWDLSHAVGAVPMDLGAAGVDLAVGCTYKYLCGGPGAPAFLYCRSELQPVLENPIEGWFSHHSPFTFESDYTPAAGVEKFLTGTPPVLSLAAIEAGVDLVLEAGIETLRRRSVELSEKLLAAVAKELVPLGFQLRSPTDSRRRGSHVSLAHPEARRITENLIRRHRVVPDFRTPDNIRLGIAPLYTTEWEVEQAVNALKCTVRDGEFESIVFSPKSQVT